MTGGPSDSQFITGNLPVLSRELLPVVEDELMPGWVQLHDRARGKPFWWNIYYRCWREDRPDPNDDGRRSARAGETELSRSQLLALRVAVLERAAMLDLEEGGGDADEHEAAAGAGAGAAAAVGSKDAVASSPVGGAGAAPSSPAASASAAAEGSDGVASTLTSEQRAAARRIVRAYYSLTGVGGGRLLPPGFAPLFFSDAATLAFLRLEGQTGLEAGQAVAAASVAASAAAKRAGRIGSNSAGYSGGAAPLAGAGGPSSHSSGSRAAPPMRFSIDTSRGGERASVGGLASLAEGAEELSDDDDSGADSGTESSAARSPVGRASRAARARGAIGIDESDDGTDSGSVSSPASDARRHGGRASGLGASSPATSAAASADPVAAAASGLPPMQPQLTPEEATVLRAVDDASTGRRWVEFFSCENARAYYVDRQTRLSSWEPPPEPALETDCDRYARSWDIRWDADKVRWRAALGRIDEQRNIRFARLRFGGTSLLSCCCSVRAAAACPVACERPGGRCTLTWQIVSCLLGNSLRQAKNTHVPLPIFGFVFSSLAGCTVLCAAR